MKQLGLIIILVGFWSCKIDTNKGNTFSKIRKNKDFYLKKEIPKNEISKFYTDYQILDRKGINEIIMDTLKVPFIQVYSNSDTTDIIKVFYNDYNYQCIIPTHNQVIYSFFDIFDGPRHIFSKIDKNELIRYAYDVNPYSTNEIVLPSEIEIIKQDTLYTYSVDCLNIKCIKGKVLPFEGKLDRNCEDCLIQFYSNDPKDINLHHYYKRNKPNENLSKQKPGDGIYGYKKIFKYWRDFHNLQRMI